MKVLFTLFVCFACSPVCLVKLEGYHAVNNVDSTNFYYPTFLLILLYTIVRFHCNKHEPCLFHGEYVLAS